MIITYPCGQMERGEEVVEPKQNYYYCTLVSLPSRTSRSSTCSPPDTDPTLPADLRLDSRTHTVAKYTVMKAAQLSDSQVRDPPNVSLLLTFLMHNGLV